MLNNEVNFPAPHFPGANFPGANFSAGSFSASHFSTACSLKLERNLKVKILNIEVDNISIFELLRLLKFGVVLTPNVDHLMQLQHDREFLEIYDQASYRICDSQVLLYASRFLGTPLKQKICGSDFFPAFCNFHRGNPKIRVFLLGGATGSPEQAAARINHRIGRQIIVGSYSPPFGFEQDELECLRIVQKIQQSGANVLAVGVGAPKQEKWIHHYKDRLPTIDLFLGIGATIDFEAGTMKRSPRWVSQFGLEWLYRLLAEPQRLWKRYLVRDLPFLGLILLQKLGLYRFSPPSKPSYPTLSPALLSGHESDECHSSLPAFNLSNSNRVNSSLADSSHYVGAEPQSARWHG